MKRSSKARDLMAILIALLFALAISACSMGGTKEKVPEENLAHFTISNEYCTLERGGLAIKGTITNDCEVPVSDVVICYNIYGDDGRPTRDRGAEPANEWRLFYLQLNPGESDEFSVWGEISDYTNGVASFEFASFSCTFDEKNDYKKKKVTGYVTREESEQLVAAAKEQIAN